jgi:hypothetical protein
MLSIFKLNLTTTLYLSPIKLGIFECFCLDTLGRTWHVKYFTNYGLCRPHRVVALPPFIIKWPSFGCYAKIHAEANTKNMRNRR